jgi:hypothetical protein
VFERTVGWIEENRLECATFHILTPYPGTPLFAQMQSEHRLLHTDWSLYDTSHVVFRPRHMSAERLADGYAWCYRHLPAPADRAGLATHGGVDAATTSAISQIPGRQ